MKRNQFYLILLITLTNLFVSDGGYGREADQKTQESKGIINQALMNQERQGDAGVSTRAKKRSEGREKQKKGKEIQKKITKFAEPMHDAGMMASTLAYASGDPHARLAAMAFNITIYAVEGLGKGIAGILKSVGRYQERSQEILSNMEVLIEDFQKTTDKIKALKKKLQELLDVEKEPEPSTSSSVLKQKVQNLWTAQKSVQNKVRQSTDIFTNTKAHREKDIKATQAELKVQEENSKEIIRIIQIKLLQDGVKEINKIISKDSLDNTITDLKSKRDFYQTARLNLSKNKSKQKKQLAEIQEEEARVNKDLVYYLEYQSSPQKNSQELEEEVSDLSKEINKLMKLTKLGDAVYLQNKDVQLDSNVNRSAIVSLYKENDELKEHLGEIINNIYSEIDAIKSQLKALDVKSP